MLLLCLSPSLVPPSCHHHQRVLVLCSVGAPRGLRLEVAMENLQRLQARVCVSTNVVLAPGAINTKAGPGLLCPLLTEESPHKLEDNSTTCHMSWSIKESLNNILGVLSGFFFLKAPHLGCEVADIVDHTFLRQKQSASCTALTDSMDINHLTLCIFCLLDKGCHICVSQ